MRLVTGLETIDLISESPTGEAEVAAKDLEAGESPLSILLKVCRVSQVFEEQGIRGWIGYGRLRLFRSSRGINATDTLKLGTFQRECMRNEYLQTQRHL